MNDIDWTITLRKRKLRQQRQNILLAILLTLLATCSIWYFFFYTRTPEYALKQAFVALEEKNSTHFQQYVNLKLLTSKAYDDLTVDLFAYDATLTPQSKVLFEKFYILVKPELTSGSIDTILNRIETGVWVLPNGTDILKGRQLGIDFERFLERSQLRNTTLVSLGSMERNGNSAIAHLSIQEDYTQTPFTMDLAMERNEDGYWQVAYIMNYKAHLNTVAPLQNKDIAEYIQTTQDIVDTNNLILAEQQEQFKSIMETSDGVLSETQRMSAMELLQDEVIPTLKKRQKDLDEIPVPQGAAYLSRLRQQSTEATIKTWQHLIKALKGNNQKEYETTETLHKHQLEIELRIEDIIKHTAVSKNIPNVP